MSWVTKSFIVVVLVVNYLFLLVLSELVWRSVKLYYAGIASEISRFVELVLGNNWLIPLAGLISIFLVLFWKTKHSGILNIAVLVCFGVLNVVALLVFLACIVPWLPHH